jgi:transcriptional regulator GlxA family with amidase domain
MLTVEDLMTRRIGLLLPPDFEALHLMAATVHELANRVSGEACYVVRLLSEHGGIVTGSSGIGVLTEAAVGHDVDTLLVAGQTVPAAPSAPGFIALLCQAGSRARRVAAICSGAFLLAEAGLLDGRLVTTHWALARALQHGYPRLRVEEDRIVINDGTLWTSAGMSACADLCLALVESDHGAGLARSVAHRLVLQRRRSGGQSQFSGMLALAPASERIRRWSTPGITCANRCRSTHWRPRPGSAPASSAAASASKPASRRRARSRCCGWRRRAP